MAFKILSIADQLRRSRRRWLVTGCAGFIGSHIIEELLRAEQQVLGIDNFDTGCQENLTEVQRRVGEKAFSNLTFVEADICDSGIPTLFKDIDFVLHQAARGSVPRSIADPLGTNHSNVTGFVNIIKAASDARVKAFVYASSSSVYGDNSDLPKREDAIGRQLSPYAASKRANEIYATAFSNLFGLNTIGFRYFNVFGPRQNPAGPYAAVIPTWFSAIKSGRNCTIFGDGTTSRDFCYVGNVVQANLRAAFYLENSSSECHVLNIGGGRATSLQKLNELICNAAAPWLTTKGQSRIEYAPFRPGDIAHSLADVSKAEKLLGYQPEVSVEEGLNLLAHEWFENK